MMEGADATDRQPGTAAAGGGTLDTDEPTVADSGQIHAGSPFAGKPLPPRPEYEEQVYDIGPVRYTALGAVAAAILVLCFGAAAAWWFPAGGILIAALGCMLSLFGMLSPRKQTAALLLVTHVFVFLFSYSRALI